jgi:hypothetical protein
MGFFRRNWRNPTKCSVKSGVANNIRTVHFGNKDYIAAVKPSCSTVSVAENNVNRVFYRRKVTNQRASRPAYRMQEFQRTA